MFTYKSDHWGTRVFYDGELIVNINHQRRTYYDKATYYIYWTESGRCLTKVTNKKFKTKRKAKDWISDNIQYITESMAKWQDTV